LEVDMLYAPYTVAVQLAERISALEGGIRELGVSLDEIEKRIEKMAEWAEKLEKERAQGLLNVSPSYSTVSKKST